MKVTTVRKADGTYDYKLSGVRGGVSTLTPWGARVQGLRAARLMNERESVVYRVKVAESGKLIGEFETKAEAWKAVQESDYAGTVTVSANGKLVATFQWCRTYEGVPSRVAPGTVAPVFALCQWKGRRGLAEWVATGVERVHDGHRPYLRTAR